MGDDKEEQQAITNNPLLDGDGKSGDQAPGQVMDKPKTGRGKKAVVFLLVIVLIAAAAGGVYYWQKQKANKQADELKSQIDALKQQVADAEKKAKEVEAADADETKDWKTYTFDKTGLSVMYPSDWVTKDISPPGTEGEIVEEFQKATSNTTEEIFTLLISNKSLINTSEVVEISPVTTYKGKQLYIVLLSDVNTQEGEITSAVLTDKKVEVGQRVKDSYIQGTGGKTYLLAHLLPKNAKNNPGRSLEQYKNNLDYNTLVTIYKSVEYK